MTTQTVHVRINDKSTGEPTPVRLRITSADGEYHAPFGRLANFATGRNQDVGGNLRLGRKSFAYIDGTCEVALPAGPLAIDIAKGPEYLPRIDQVEQVSGKISLRLEIERWIDLRKLGWYSGDVRAHALTPHAALLEAQAEDLGVVNLLAGENIGPVGPMRPTHGHSVHPNLLAFSGQHAALETPGHMVVVNTHNVHPVLGSLGLLNCHRAVYPLRFGEPGADDWTLLDWCQQCHRKQGLVVWTDTCHETPGFRYGEPLADLLLGQIDAFELTFHEDSPFDALPDWYALLNCGLDIPLAGASGKDSNCVALGAMRTYARLRDGEALTYRNWIEALRAGRTFVTNGPLLSFAVAGQDPGTTSKLAASGGTVAVHATAQSAVPFEHLELIVNGKPIAETTASGHPVASATLAVDVPVKDPCWIAARCRGAKLLPQHPAGQRVFAHTSPVFVQVAERAFPRCPAAVKRFDQELEHMTRWAACDARCSNEHERQRLVDVFRRARAALKR